MVPQKELDFPDAVEAIILGAKVTKKEWGNPKMYLILKDGFLKIMKADGTLPQVLLSEGDLFGKDWYIIGSSN